MPNTETASTESPTQVTVRNDSSGSLVAFDGRRELTMDELDTVAGGTVIPVSFTGCDHVYNVTIGNDGGPMTLGQAVEHGQWLHSLSGCSNA